MDCALDLEEGEARGGVEEGREGVLDVVGRGCGGWVEGDGWHPDGCGGGLLGFGGLRGRIAKMAGDTRVFAIAPGEELFVVCNGDGGERHLVGQARRV